VLKSLTKLNIQNGAEESRAKGAKNLFLGLENNCIILFYYTSGKMIT
jgi:hypothetical protein